MPYLYVLFAVPLRALSHASNVTPIGATFLFSGANFRGKTNAILLPLFALIMSDVVVMQGLYGGHHSWCDPFTWFGFASIGLLGWVLRASAAPLRLLAASLAGSLLFFLISNFGVWADGDLYPRSWSGLFASYTAAIRFFRNTVLGDLFYAAPMFASCHWLTARRVPARIAQT